MKHLSILLFFILLITSCNSKEKITVSNEIAVSILPQKYFVSKIAGDNFKINVMIPPGASPATYEPTPVQLTSLSNTNLYLKIGFTGFELAWMEKLSAANEKMKIADLSSGINLIMESSVNEQHEMEIGHHHGGVDPHIWLSPRNVIIICKNIYDELSDIYPEYEKVFKANLDSFQADLDSLDLYIAKELKELKSRSFFTYHPSLSYFARDYNLEQYPLELGGKEPSPSHLKFLIDTGKEKDIRIVFLQMQFDQRNAEALAKEINAEIVQINPLEEEWFSQMIYITDKLKTNLQ